MSCSTGHGTLCLCGDAHGLEPGHERDDGGRGGAPESALLVEEEAEPVPGRLLNELLVGPSFPSAVGGGSLNRPVLPCGRGGAAARLGLGFT